MTASKEPSKRDKAVLSAISKAGLECLNVMEKHSIQNRQTLGVPDGAFMVSTTGLLIMGCSEMIVKRQPKDGIRDELIREFVNVMKKAIINLE